MNNRMPPTETTTVCCVCGAHINGPWPAARNLSHGYCQPHYQLAKQEIKSYLALMDRPQRSTPHALAA
jgi:hypothetical protein